MVVGDDRQAPADERQRAELPDQVAVALVGRVHRDSGVGEHRLRAHGGDGEHVVGALDRVVDLVERVGHLAVLDLELRDHRARADVPVDHVVVAVDEALVVERDEDLVDGADVVLVEREPLALVVARGAEALELADDPRAVGLLPLPGALEECVAAEVVARGALGAQLLLEDGVDGDRGVVGAENPERVVPLHPPGSHERVLHRVVEGVPHVQGAGDVRRRDRDREVLLGGPGGLGVEVAALDPVVEDPPLDLGRLPARGLLEALAAVGVHWATILGWFPWAARSCDTPHRGVRGIARPPVTVTEPPPGIRIDRDVEVAGARRHGPAGERLPPRGRRRAGAGDHVRTPLRQGQAAEAQAARLRVRHPVPRTAPARSRSRSLRSPPGSPPTQAGGSRAGTPSSTATCAAAAARTGSAACSPSRRARTTTT